MPDTKAFFHPCCFRAILLAAGIALGAGSSLADERDHDRARKALEAGEILPLRTILTRVERDHPGQVLDVELEQAGQEHDNRSPRWIYEIKILRTGGSLVKLKVDARDGSIISSKQKPRAHHSGEKY